MVDGLAKFEARWKRIPKKAVENVRIAMEKSAIEIVEEMRARAPHESGALANSIRWTWGEAPAGSFTISTFNGRKFSSLRITIFAGTRDKSLGDQDAFYARFQEFGTINMSANPFFFPVWRARRKRVKGRVSRAISKAIRES